MIHPAKHSFISADLEASFDVDGANSVNEKWSSNPITAEPRVLVMIENFIFLREFKVLHYGVNIVSFAKFQVVLEHRYDLLDLKLSCSAKSKQVYIVEPRVYKAFGFGDPLFQLSQTVLLLFIHIAKVAQRLMGPCGFE